MSVADRKSGTAVGVGGIVLDGRGRPVGWRSEVDVISWDRLCLLLDRLSEITMEDVRGIMGLLDDLMYRGVLTRDVLRGEWPDKPEDDDWDEDEYEDEED